jgi:tripartite-type tricarboxylate transporter receptor subunit TctC
MAGRVDAYFAPLQAGLPFIQAGKLKALGVTSTQRVSQLPNVPTIAESGVPKFEFLLWFGLWGPSGMPQPVVNKIRTVFAQALADPGVKERLSTQGTSLMNLTPAQFSKFVDDEIIVSANLFRAAGIKPQ